MKKIFAAAFIVLYGFTNLSAQSGGEYCAQSKINFNQQAQSLSKTAYPGDENIDVTYYKLDLNVSYTNRYLKGTVILKGKAGQDSIKDFFLDLWSGFKINSVSSKGIGIQYNLDFFNRLNISLEKSYSSDEEFNIEISYEGQPTSSGGIGGSFIFSATPAGSPVIWTLSQPYGSRDWWPCKDTPADKADSSDVWITADKSFTSVSNGVLQNVVDNSDGTKTYKWHNGYPIANYLISIALSNYEVYQNHYLSANGNLLSITNYIYNGNTARYKSVLDLVPKMMEIFSEKFGEYPFINEKYGHAECGFSGGMEHQTCTSLGVFYENIIAHELAHQWFGDMVTCKNWNNIWLNEGFASYSECIFREAMYGKNDFKNYVSNFMDNYAVSAEGSIYIPDSFLQNVSYVFDSKRTYKKGAIVLHMLRGIIGDENFFNTLKEYTTEPGLSYNTATTEDFKKITERVSGQNLDYFFNQWIYGENFPTYTFGWTFRKNSGGSYTLVLMSKQTANSHPQYFTMPIQVTYKTNEETKTVTIFNERQSQKWEILINGEPEEVIFDPDNWILKKVDAVIKNADEGQFIPDYTLMQNYPNPFNPGTTIEYEIQVGNNIKLTVYDVAGRQIKILVDEFKNAGIHRAKFNAGQLQLASGIYFYELKAGDSIQTKKMLFIK